MKRAILLMLCLTISVPNVTVAAEGDMEFLQEEAKVVSASLLPHAVGQTPATVYTVTQEDIKASGAVNIWDALRNVPGLHVMQTRTGQGELGIRGINRALNSRTLVLVDGQSTFNPYIDYLTWASLPVNLDDIDRIEVVEGPASAVYGANALSGVVNIITKRPEQVNGTQATYTGGERNTHVGSVVTGKKQGSLGYRLSGGWYTTNQFEDADTLAAQTGRVNGTVDYEFSKHSSLSVAGGFADYQAVVTDGIGTPVDQGRKSNLRADYRFHDTLFRTNWNHNRSSPQGYAPLEGYRLDYDNVEVGLEQVFSLPFRNQAVIGASYKNQQANSELLQDGYVTQDFWSTFFEDKWDISNQWLLMLSGRVDSHPLTPLRFSPRGSLLFTPAPENVFRVSAGTSYRNPTLLENYANFSVATFPNNPTTGIPDPPFSTLNLQEVGNRELTPESLQSVEAAYTHRTRRFTSSLTGYHWVTKDPISLATASAVGPLSPTAFGLQRVFVNLPQKTYAWGGELALEYAAKEWLNLFANYSYCHLYGEIPPVTSPRNQTNTGFKTRYKGLSTQWVLHWLDTVTTAYGQTALPAYFMLDARVGYAFHGKLSGLELAVNAFNLLNHDHYEYSSPEGGEIVKGRLTGTVSYRF
jgi:iron complex outermembrane recepter protein